MPTYDYKCEAGHRTERVSSVANYQRSVPCGHEGCGNVAWRFMAYAPMGFVKADVSYRCPITDKPITSRREHEENLAQHGCRVLESGEREEVIRRREAADAAFDASIEKTAEEFVETLPSAKREQLGRELESGLDVTVVRQ